MVSYVELQLAAPSSLDFRYTRVSENLLSQFLAVYMGVSFSISRVCLMPRSSLVLYDFLPVRFFSSEHFSRSISEGCWISLIGRLDCLDLGHMLVIPMLETLEGVIAVFPALESLMYPVSVNARNILRAAIASK